MSKRRSASDGPEAASPREIELKLDVAPGDMGRIRAHPLLQAAPARTSRLSAVYFDTDDLALREAGISLRLREEGDRRIQTIKAERAPGLALDRSEWSHPVADGALDLSAAAGTALEPLLADQGVREGLAPRFTVEVQRTAVLIERDGAAIEIALDEGTVGAGGAGEHLAEVELELRHGDPAALFGAALSLSEAAPLSLSFKAKSERGYDLLTGARPKAVKAEPLRLTPGLTSGGAFQAIARSCLRQVVANEAVLRGARDPDAVHQMRVALRRLRAAIGLFKDALADGERDAVRGELKALANALGPARDLDVLLAETLRPAAEGHADDPGFAALVADAERRRDEAYGEALARLRSGAFARTILKAAAWIEAGDWIASGDKALREARDRPIATHAEAELDRRRRKVRRRARGLRRMAPEARHEVRIEVKKLRYAAEFFASLFERHPKRRKATLSTLATLQEAMGELNDIAVHAAEPAKGALAALQAEQAARVPPLLADAKRAASRLRGTKPFWRG